MTRSNLLSKARGLSTVALALALCLTVSLALPGTALACENFVGGVCLDKKKAPAKKATPTRKTKKKATRKPVAKPKPVASAQKCVTTRTRAGGLNNLSVGYETTVTLKNTCKAEVVAHLRLSNCVSGGRAYFAKAARRDGTMTVSLRAGQTVRLKAYHQKRQLAKGQAVFGNYFYSTDARAATPSYPKPPC